MKLSFILLIVLALGFTSSVSAQYYCVKLYGATENVLTNCFPFSVNGTEIGNLCTSPTSDDYVTDDMTITVADGWQLQHVDLWYGFSIKNSPLSKTGLPLISKYTETCNPARGTSSSCAIPISIIGLFASDALSESYKLPCKRTIDLAVHAVVTDSSTGQDYDVWSAGTPFVPTDPESPTYSTLKILCGKQC
jgi:hypothetical protein